MKIAFSGTLRSVLLYILTDVSEEFIASIIRAIYQTTQLNIPEDSHLPEEVNTFNMTELLVYRRLKNFLSN
jgi:hypothetical protein